MNNKGFTLTELLVTLALIVILALVVSNNIISVTRKQETERFNNFSANIEKAACLYADLKDITNLENSICRESNCVVSFNDLIEEGLLDAELVNPNDEEKVSDQGENTVLIKYSVDGQKVCSYRSSGSYDLEGPEITFTPKLGKIVITVSDPSGLYATQISDIITPSVKNVLAYRRSDDDLLDFYDNDKKEVTYTIIPKSSKIIYVHAYDKNNNYNSIAIDINDSYIDKEAPIFRSSKPIKNYSNSNSKDFELTISDNVDLGGYVITSSYSDPSSYNNVSRENNDEIKNVIFTYNFKATGYYYVHMIDKTGNKSAERIYVDLEKPVVKDIKVNGSKLSFNVSDNYGLAKYLVSSGKFDYNDNNSELSWKGISGTSASKEETISNTGTYYIYAMDNQYNVSSEYSAFVDLTKPIISKFQFVAASKRFDFTFSDNDKVKDYVLTTSSSVPSSGWTNVGQSSYSGSKVVSSAGTYYLYVRDNNGNIQSSAVVAPKTAFSYAAVANTCQNAACGILSQTAKTCQTSACGETRRCRKEWSGNGINDVQYTNGDCPGDGNYGPRDCYDGACTYYSVVSSTTNTCQNAACGYNYVYKTCQNAACGYSCPNGGTFNSSTKMCDYN